MLTMNHIASNRTMVKLLKMLHIVIPQVSVHDIVFMTINGTFSDPRTKT